MAGATRLYFCAWTLLPMLLHHWASPWWGWWVMAWWCKMVPFVPFLFMAGLVQWPSLPRTFIYMFPFRKVKESNECHERIHWPSYIFCSWVRVRTLALHSYIGREQSVLLLSLGCALSTLMACVKNFLQDDVQRFSTNSAVPYSI